MSSYKKDYYENACIYMWKNKLDGKCYIGQTVNEKQRYNKHVNAVHSLKKTSNKFHNALKKYGLENFEYSVLEYISGPTAELLKTLDDLEQKYIKEYNSIINGYNLTSGGQKYSKHSNEAKHHMSIAHIGHTSWNKGLKLSEEHKRHLSESHMGQKSWNKGMSGQYTVNMSTEERQKKAEKLKQIRTGYKASDETRKKISEANHKRYKENPDSFKTPESAKEILRQKNIGKKMSEESRRKMSEAKKGKTPWNKGIKMSEYSKNK